jgi:hypothetical protein
MGNHDKNFIWKYMELTPEMKKMEKQTTMKATNLLWLDDKTYPGTFYIENHWIWSLSGPMPKPPDNFPASHSHDFDEVQGFFGSQQSDPYDLGAEIDFYLEDELYTFNKTCFIFIPRGMKHLPMTIKKIWSPFMWLTAGNGKTLNWEGARPTGQ